MDAISVDHRSNPTHGSIQAPGCRLMASDHTCHCSLFSTPEEYFRFHQPCLQRRHALYRTMQTVEFRHRPLGNSKTQIRLLMIWRTENDELHGHLHHFSLDEAPPYVAVSYMWGRGIEKKILLDDRHIPILPNLFSFLHTFVEKNAPVMTATGLQSRYPMWLWTDKLCIDQSSGSEKNDQVPLMAQIYTRAKVVIAWLGINNIDCKAFKAIRCAFDWKAKFGTEWKSYTEDQDQAIQHLINNGYWSRVWVVQEIKLAQLATFWCGLEELAQNDLLKLKETKVGTGSDAYLIEFMLKSDLVSLASVCADVADRLCTDPRDRIYGIQSLLDVEDRVRVDYEIKIEALFVELARKMIEHYSLKPIDTGYSEGLSTDAMELLFDIGVAMKVFRDGEDLGLSEAYNCFRLLALYPERLEWHSSQELIAKWLPHDSRCVMLELGRLLKDVVGRAEYVDELRRSTASYEHWWTCDGP